MDKRLRDGAGRYIGIHCNSLPRTRLYRIWDHMKYRCYNPKAKGYKYYGARGITVCDEWRHSFQVFRAWAVANGYGESLTIDRINNDLGYSPDNCRWATRKQQNQNQRRQRKVSERPSRKRKAWRGKTGRRKTSSRFNGVSYAKRDRSWVASITRNYRSRHLGTFRTAVEAAFAYDDALSKILSLEDGHFNFPERIRHAMSA